MPPVVVCGQLFDEAAWGQNGHQCLHRMSNHNNTSNGNNNKQYLQVTNAALTTMHQMLACRPQFCRFIFADIHFS